MAEDHHQDTHIQTQSGYNRLTTLEIEDIPLNPPTIPTRDDQSSFISEFRQNYSDFHHQLGIAFHGIDWDRIFVTSFITVSVFLVVVAFFPYMSSQLLLDQRFDHEFSLNSLTISEFKASASEVTGKCEAVLNVTNNGDRSIYHENSVLSIFIDHELLWVTRTGDFFLETGSSILFNVSINKTTVSVPASFVPTALLESQKLQKSMNFKVKYDGILREGLAAWYEERSHIYVVCGWIEMWFLDETAIKGGPGNCTIEIP